MSMLYSLKSLFAWRDAMMKSELSSTTKLVLHTLASHLNVTTGDCFPSINTVAVKASLSDRVVGEHVSKAAKLGWILKLQVKGNGQQWKLGHYQLQTPTGTAILERSETKEKVVTLPQKGSDFDDTKVVTQSHTNNEVSILKDNSARDELNLHTTTEGFDSFWESYPSHPRKGGRENCVKLWVKRNLESNTKEILKHLEWQKEDWSQGNNKYVSNPKTYLENAMWDGWDKDSAITVKNEYVSR